MARLILTEAKIVETVAATMQRLARPVSAMQIAEAIPPELADQIRIGQVDDVLPRMRGRGMVRPFGDDEWMLIGGVVQPSPAPAASPPSLKGKPPRSGESVGTSLYDRESIRRAIAAEIELAGSKRNMRLQIDAIEIMPATAGRFRYRLSLSSPVRFAAEQRIAISLGKSAGIAHATVISNDDQGLVIECDQALSQNARLLQVEFDPAMILRALGDYLDAMADTPRTPAQAVAARRIDGPTVIAEPSMISGLNAEQSTAVEAMTRQTVYLLWGPPGTGKTTTLGAAIARWAERGRRILIVSTSNAAVDVALLSVLGRITVAQRRGVVRLGSSLDTEVQQYTAAGHHSRADPKRGDEVARAQVRLAAIRSLLEHPMQSGERQKRYAEMSKLELVISEFHATAEVQIAQVAAQAQVTGCTLAKMVLDPSVRETPFDVVVVDEASMASQIFAVAASLLATKRVVYAGDPNQLPPIAATDDSDRPDAPWFSQNIYDWFDITFESASDDRRLGLLRTQYRMTNAIGGLVSRLSYGDILRHGRAVAGERATFVDVGPAWESSHYSVAEESYYHLAALPIVSTIAALYADETILLLSPYRTQRSLLSALAADLRQRHPKLRISASTIHRSQGSEAKTVIVDLTDHNRTNATRFFYSPESANLFNVAISRAKDQLFVIGSRSAIRLWASQQPFWRRVNAEIGNGFVPMDALGELLDDLPITALPAAIPNAPVGDHPTYYNVAKGGTADQALLRQFATAIASSKLLVVPRDGGRHTHLADTTVREDKDGKAPGVYADKGHLSLPVPGGWLTLCLPHSAKLIRRIAFGQLVDDEIDGQSTRRLHCPACKGGVMVLRRLDGWSLVCAAGECHHRQRATLADAKLVVRLAEGRCPHGHPLTVRDKDNGLFAA